MTFKNCAAYTAIAAMMVACVLAAVAIWAHDSPSNSSEASVAGEKVYVIANYNYSSIRVEDDLDRILAEYPNLSTTLGKGHDIEALGGAGWKIWHSEKENGFWARAPKDKKELPR